MNHRECRNLFVEALYGELTEARRVGFDSHLNECSACHESYQELQKLADAMRQRKRTEPSQAEWISFWNELEPFLKSPDSGPRHVSWMNRFGAFVRFRPAWALSLTAVALVAIGIGIGQLMVSRPLDTDSMAAGLSAAERILLNERALNYFERSKVLLLGIVNNSTVEPTSESMVREQHVSRILVSEASSLKSDLSQADEQQMRQLVADLEVILLQIANLEAEQDFPGLEIVRGGVERTGILLKINLEQMRSQEDLSSSEERESASQASSI